MILKMDKQLPLKKRKSSTVTTSLDAGQLQQLVQSNQLLASQQHQLIASWMSQCLDLSSAASKSRNLAQQRHSHQSQTGTGPLAAALAANNTAAAYPTLSVAIGGNGGFINGHAPHAPLAHALHNTQKSQRQQHQDESAAVAALTLLPLGADAQSRLASLSLASLVTSSGSGSEPMDCQSSTSSLSSTSSSSLTTATTTTTTTTTSQLASDASKTLNNVISSHNHSAAMQNNSTKRLTFSQLQHYHANGGINLQSQQCQQQSKQQILHSTLSMARPQLAGEQVASLYNSDVHMQSQPSNTTQTQQQQSFDDSAPQICMICEDKATGLHYGIITCEGCKGFFKRTVQNKRVYTCVADNKCTITKQQRNRCQSCRFQKCLRQGMVLAAVREDRMPGGRNSGAVYNMYKVKYKKHKKSSSANGGGQTRASSSSSSSSSSSLSSLSSASIGKLAAVSSPSDSSPVSATAAPNSSSSSSCISSAGSPSSTSSSSSASSSSTASSLSSSASQLALAIQRQQQQTATIATTTITNSIITSVATSTANLSLAGAGGEQPQCLDSAVLSHLHHNSHLHSQLIAGGTASSGSSNGAGSQSQFSPTASNSSPSPTSSMGSGDANSPAMSTTSSTAATAASSTATPTSPQETAAASAESGQAGQGGGGGGGGSEILKSALTAPLIEPSKLMVSIMH